MTQHTSQHIRRAAVLGSGVMGSGIACHFANVGLEVLMLDILPRDMDETETNPAVRNSVAAQALQTAIKSKPAPLYDKDFAKRITVGNFTDDMDKLGDYDWIIEVVVERLDIKRKVLGQVDKVRRKGSLVTTNTSGIPIRQIQECMSEDFRQHFCGTHFFNPARYLRLFEIIPGPDTKQEVLDFFMHYGDLYLGKTTVMAKDTPAFIGNRIGVYSLSKSYALTDELGLRIETVDKLTGPALGRPKTGTFRLGDLVGHDTGAHVMTGIRENAPDDESAAVLEIPQYYQFLIDNNFLGNKTGQGFYKKVLDEEGNRQILGLNLKTLEYEPPAREDLACLKTAKQIDDLPRRVKALFEADDKGGEFVRRMLAGLFAYSANRIPEISDNLYSIDDAMRAGYAWKMGPFQYWDTVGLQAGIDAAEADGATIPQWVRDMQAAGHDSFYKQEGGQLKYYDQQSKSYRVKPGTEAFIILDNLRDQKPVYQNSEVTLHDIGDGVACLEFTSAYNSIGEGVLRGYQEAITKLEEEGWRGMVLGNNADNFSVGANLMMIAQLAYQQEFEELNMAVNLFQQSVMRLRYSAIPVVAATQGYVFGGGCESLMHCDGAAVAAESYIGLVEAGIGVIPAGAGTKEFALRTSDSFFEGDVMIPTLIDRFKTIAMASVSTSAYEGYNYGYLIEGRDKVVINKDRNLTEAKRMVLDLADDGYTMPRQREDITVLGRGGLAALYAAANELRRGRYASDHDIKIAKKLAWVLCGGDLTGTQQVSEQYLLDIEREAFLSLCGEQKTLERIQHMLQTNKPLRN
ncbi:3-hydroxyacyl-CoA dehydrogenase/enoyl-CoA hydratase family protein [Neolewinella litorea]|uniref:3-hydroxyacyl-CoA dehydrogenase/enoyl-CoA hydratase family protein n=1 Tax=Neolewinella litorea TaxID=2562452 RepID=A0A4S4NPB3_9BACT|nr:3-hydroxyacyl-CoA dehydrogenase/enoyl-CoA hydratase family protein [Neolewinella litorea]THH41874.1 3-hydroxyacyl-CoA dehydrogenase/enoyl-CoA hydratase family protein [Neolewinella litorea]